MAKIRITKAPGKSLKKIKITELPSAKYGGPSNQFWNFLLPDKTGMAPEFETTRTLKAVPRDQANIEAEKGETVYIPDKGGLPAHYNVDGNRHSNGGTPLNVPKDSFVFSDTKKMRIKDHEILKSFGKSKGSYTPAELAKPYDINKFRKILQDPDSDPLQVKTAEKMIANYNLKLGKLGLIQESKKGFPQGIPMIAMPYMATYNINPDSILPLKQETEDIEYEEMPQAKWGMQLPKAQTGNFPGQDPESLKKFYEEQMRKRQIKEQVEEFNKRKASAEYYQKRRNTESELKKLEAEKKLENTYKTLEQLSGKSYLPLGSQKRAIDFDNAYDQYIDAVGEYSSLFPSPMIDISDINPNIPYQNILNVRMPAVSVPTPWPKPVVSTQTSTPEIQPVTSDTIRVKGKNPYLELGGSIPKYATGGPIIKTYEDGTSSIEYPNGKIEVKDKSGKVIKTIPSKGQQDIKPKSKVGFGITAHKGDFTSTVDPITGKPSKDWNATKRFADDSLINKIAKDLGFKPEEWEGESINEKFQKFLYSKPEWKAEIDKAHEKYGMPAAGTKFDGFLGVRWIDALGNLSKKEPEIKDTAAKVEKEVTSPGPVPNPPAEYTHRSANAPWWLQDVINTASAAGTRLGLKKYLPWAPQVQPQTPRPTFYDPTRELAANTEAMAIGTQGAGLFAGPQAYNARLAQIQGASAKNAANILSRYHNQNVGVANQFENIKTNIYNQNQQLNANTAKQLYDQTTIANQQFDNAKRQANNEIRAAYVNALTNRARTQTLNTLYPHYQVDPMTGGFLTFDEGSRFRPGREEKTLKEQIAEISAISGQPMTNRDIIEYIGRGSKQDRRRDELEEYDDRSNWYDQYVAGIPQVGPYGY